MQSSVELSGNLEAFSRPGEGLRLKNTEVSGQDDKNGSVRERLTKKARGEPGGVEIKKIKERREGAHSLVFKSQTALPWQQAGTGYSFWVKDGIILPGTTSQLTVCVVVLSTLVAALFIQ